MGDENWLCSVWACEAFFRGLGEWGGGVGSSERFGGSVKLERGGRGAGAGVGGAGESGLPGDRRGGGGFKGRGEECGGVSRPTAEGLQKHRFDEAFDDLGTVVEARCREDGIEDQREPRGRGQVTDWRRGLGGVAKEKGRRGDGSRESLVGLDGKAVCLCGVGGGIAVEGEPGRFGEFSGVLFGGYCQERRSGRGGGGKGVSYEVYSIRVG